MARSPIALWRNLHLTLTVVWFVAVLPTVIWWNDSIVWVALKSCWANAASHFSAWQGTRAEEKSDE